MGVLGNACRCAHIKGGTRVGVGGSHERVCDSESERAHTRVHGCSTGVGARSAGVGVHRLGVCVCTGGCGCAQHTAAPTCLGATQGCSPQNNLIFHQTNPFSPETNLFSLQACSPLPSNQPILPSNQPVFPPLPPNHAVPPQWSAAGNRSTAPSASARGTTGSWGSTAWAGCCSGCRSCETPASPTLRNSSDPPLSLPPHKHSLYPLCFSPPLHHALIKVLGNGAWLCLCWEPSALSRPFLQPRVPAGVGNRIPPPSSPPPISTPVSSPCWYLSPIYTQCVPTTWTPIPTPNPFLTPPGSPFTPYFCPFLPRHQTPSSPKDTQGFPPDACAPPTVLSGFFPTRGGVAQTRVSRCLGQ